MTTPSYTGGDEPAPAAGTGLKPSVMRGNEQRYGYAVAVVLVAMSLLNLTVTHGKGAPAHPATTLSVIGLVVSLGLFAALQTKNRLIVPLSAVIAAFFVDLPAVPNTLTTAHLVALLIPVAYALWLTQRQRKAQAGARDHRARQTPAERRAQAVGCKDMKTPAYTGRPQMVCPHCLVQGRIVTASVRVKQGISGGKATGALLTGGVSLLATGLSRKREVTQATCKNCNMTWVIS